MSTIVKDKNFNDILRGFLATGIIFLLILIGLLLKQGFSATDLLPVIVNPTPVPEVMNQNLLLPLNRLKKKRFS